MPIYEYRCGDCGHRQDHLQKHSDPLIEVCPACGGEKMERLPSWLAPDLKSDKIRKSWRAAAARGGDISNFSTSERNSFKK